MIRATTLLAAAVAASLTAQSHGQTLVSTATPEPIAFVQPASFQAPAESADTTPPPPLIAEPTQPAPQTPTPDLSSQFSAAEAASSTATRRESTSSRLAQAPEMFGDSATLIGLSGTNSQFGEITAELGQITTSAQFPVGSFGLKVSDNNSPLPRDRVYYRFSNYQDLIKVQSQAVSASTNQTFVTPKSLPVHTVGLEKTFFDGMTSVEVRVPFSERVLVDELYATDNGDFLNAASFATAGEGNVSVITKAVLGDSDDLLWTGGMAIESPTGRDSAFDFPEISGEYLNKAVFIYPYLAALWTPDDRCFHQAFLGINVPVSSDELLLYDPTQFDQVELSRTDVDLPTLLSVDWSSGYWLCRNRDSCVTDLALIGEVHYTTSLGTPDGTSTPFAAAGASSVDLVNLTGGVHVQLGPKMSLRVSGVVPVADRPFDNELTAQWTYWY
jgi:hypothetical protein